MDRDFALILENWVVFILTLVGIIVWLLVKVNKHIQTTLVSDVTSVDILNVVTFSGVVSEVDGTPKPNTAGTLQTTDPSGLILTIPFTTDDKGLYSVAWTAILPAGDWSFKAIVESVESVTLIISVVQRDERK